MCNSMQLLYYQAPLSAVFVACVIPVFEPVFSKGGIFGTEWSLAAVVRIVVFFHVNSPKFSGLGSHFYQHNAKLAQILAMALCLCLS